MAIPSRWDLAAHMRSTRRQLRDHNRKETWTVKGLWVEVRQFRENGHKDCDPVVAGALQRLIDSGAQRTYWSLQAMYQAEDLAEGRSPSQGRELVRFYDEMFNSGQLFLTELWEQVRLADPPRSQPSRPPRPDRTPGDDVAWLADLTVPDGVEVPPNLEFTKSWRLYNAGSVPWIGRRLVRLGPATSYGLVRSRPWVSIADTEPDHTVDISVTVRAPTVETSHCEPRWKIADSNGVHSFPDLNYGIGMIVVVVEGSPPPDMAVPGAVEAGERKLARLRADRSRSR
ncbi:NBR1-Ig-like domain-containing protein [Mycolicibacterium sediminis]|uniref:NBR1-Ig-like domain-containing protein n=1 Tax=Mycolicibacterium sediminis TaxID=1286180 RepID=UPI001FEB1BAE|nr:NBR1-Ig-like domain-containing protein [Mycolicibacterium sediminis]